MYKLKIVQPKPLKVKFSVAFPPIILANLQEKTVEPSKEEIIVMADASYDGLSKVTVGAIPSEYIIPSGELDITENGTYDVTNYVNANVNIPEKQLGIKTITSNGTYKATDDSLDGYSQVEVATNGVDINDYFITSPSANKTVVRTIKAIPPIDTSNYKSMSEMFYNMENLISIPLLNTSNVTNMSSMCRGCINLLSFPPIDTSNVTNISQTWFSNRKLTTIPLLDFSSVTGMSATFNDTGKLTNLGGFKDLGKSYDPTRAANYGGYTLDISANTLLLTHESLMNVINNLYDIASKGVQPQKLVLGSANLVKLTDEEIGIAQAKGWTVS